MDLQTVKKYLEKGYGGEDENNVPTIHGDILLKYLSTSHDI